MLARASYSGPSCTTSSGSGSSSEVPAGDQVRTEISAPSEGAGRSEVRLVPGSAGGAPHFGGGGEGKTKTLLLSNPPTHPHRVLRVSDQLAAAVVVAQVKQVLHPAHRRAGDDKLPPVAAAAEVEHVSWYADVLEQPHPGQLTAGIGYPEGQLDSRFGDHSHIVPGARRADNGRGAAGASPADMRL